MSVAIEVPGQVTGRRLLGELLALSTKISLTQLAPVLLSLYLSRLVALQGDLHFTNFSLMAEINAMIFVTGSNFLMSLYFVGGHARGGGDQAGYEAAIVAGAVLAASIAVVSVLVSVLIGPMLATMKMDASVVDGAGHLGMLAALGVLPPLLLMVYRVHASLNDYAGQVTGVSLLGVMLAATLATLVFQWPTWSGQQVTRGVVLSVAVANWVMLGVAVVGVRLTPRLRLRGAAIRGAFARLQPAARQVFAAGWPIATIVMLDYLASLVSSIFVSRFWLPDMPIHMVAMLWTTVALMIPLGIAQAAVQKVAITNAQGNIALRNRGAWLSLALGIACGAVTAIIFVVAQDAMATLVLGRVPNADERALLHRVMPLAGILGIGQGVIIIAASILRGVGEARAPLPLALLGYGVIVVGGQLLFGLVFGMGTVGIWVGMTTGFGATAALLCVRCRTVFGRAHSHVCDIRFTRASKATPSIHATHLEIPHEHHQDE